MDPPVLRVQQDKRDLQAQLARQGALGSEVGPGRPGLQGLQEPPVELDRLVEPVPQDAPALQDPPARPDPQGLRAGHRLFLLMLSRFCNKRSLRESQLHLLTL
ncbi:MAG: hypothetical protein A3E80_05055 [Chlamydiae bacterium RIFCSPHIGHO2_12_FULL_49_9]|nr:MAG: hypothetical protein A3E80_05055 [Chlamydiae bacterium RIFCSPHIGHO2_12_FULL_49_9]